MIPPKHRKVTVTSNDQRYACVMKYPVVYNCQWVINSVVYELMYNVIEARLNNRDLDIGIEPILWND